MICPYGNGKCIDPGYPSDCDLNGCTFSSAEERARFDSLPDLYELHLNGMVERFKNSNQLQFLINDFPQWRNAKVYLLHGGDKVDILIEMVV